MKQFLYIFKFVDHFNNTVYQPIIDTSLLNAIKTFKKNKYRVKKMIECGVVRPSKIKSFKSEYTVYYKSCNTKDKVYFVNYHDQNEVYVFRPNGELIDCGRSADDMLVDDILNDKIINSSNYMKYNIREIKKAYKNEN
jgi:cytochrome oxidase Cu insertion factor (SCO1/SenC/PrrC family)